MKEVTSVSALSNFCGQSVEQMQEGKLKPFPTPDLDLSLLLCMCFCIMFSVLAFLNSGAIGDFGLDDSLL